MDESSTEGSPTTEKQKKPFPQNYEFLRPENQVVEGPKWLPEWMLSEYVRCTDGLIGKLDGSIPLKGRDVYINTPEGMKKVKEDLPPPESVIYLDKSARPVSWLVRALWSQLAQKVETPDGHSAIPPKPQDFFLNIDKDDWLRRMGVPEHLIQDAPDEMVDIRKIDRDQISRLRAVFSSIQIDENNLEEAWNHPTLLDGQHVMILDEVRSSGKTLEIAQQLLALALPEAVFSGEHWAEPKMIALNGGVEVDGKLQYKREWVPAWYSQKTLMGRGVGNKEPTWPERAQEHGYPVHWRVKVGRHVLGTPTHDPKTFAKIPDTRATNIRSDIYEMSQDLAHHNILYRPSSDRPSDSDDDFDKLSARIESINQMDYQTWVAKRNAMAPKSR